MICFAWLITLPQLVFCTEKLHQFLIFLLLLRYVCLQPLQERPVHFQDHECMHLVRLLYFTNAMLWDELFASLWSACVCFINADGDRMREREGIVSGMRLSVFSKLKEKVCQSSFCLLFKYWKVRAKNSFFHKSKDAETKHLYFAFNF